MRVNVRSRRGINSYLRSVSTQPIKPICTATNTIGVRLICFSSEKYTAYAEISFLRTFRAFWRPLLTSGVGGRQLTTRHASAFPSTHDPSRKWRGPRTPPSRMQDAGDPSLHTPPRARSHRHRVSLVIKFWSKVIISIWISDTIDIILLLLLGNINGAIRNVIVIICVPLRLSK